VHVSIHTDGADCRQFITFDGADSALMVWLNGAFVGFSKDSRLPAEFEVTHLVQPRCNVLGVMVVRWSDGSYLEDQDMWRLSGLHRHVRLLSKPAAAAIRDFSVKTPLGFSAARTGDGWW